MTDDREDTSTRRFVLVVVLLLTIIGIAFTTMLVTLEYPVYLSESGNEQACKDEFGESAAYLGELEGDGIICKSGEDIHLIEGQDRPANMDTFGEYLNAVVSGEA